LCLRTGELKTNIEASIALPFGPVPAVLGKKGRYELFLQVVGINAKLNYEYVL
jgi:hypothetical protein